MSPLETFEGFSIPLVRCSEHWVGAWSILYPLVKCPSIRSWIRMSVRLSVSRPYARPSVHQFVCPSVHLTVCLFVHLSICPSICPSPCPFIQPSVSPSVRPTIRSCVRLSSVHPFGNFRKISDLIKTHWNISWSSEKCSVEVSVNCFASYWIANPLKYLQLRHQVIAQVSWLILSNFGEISE